MATELVVPNPATKVLDHWPSGFGCLAASDGANVDELECRRMASGPTTNTIEEPGVRHRNILIDYHSDPCGYHFVRKPGIVVKGAAQEMHGVGRL